MELKVFKNTVLLFVFIAVSCVNKTKQNLAISKGGGNKSTHSNKHVTQHKEVIVGANKTDLYLPILDGKNIGLVANQTSVIFKSTTNNSANDSERNYIHLVDSLLKLNISVKSVFAPEHGFRGTADAGEAVKDGIDIKTGLPLVSLYGNNKKPNAKQLEGIDFVVFDIQDVGARFYTYISTLHYVMEACAELDIPVLVLDRPNPNGHYIDGPILEPEHKSFVGMHPVPVVHGMTIGEYAKMINGEGWLKNSITCELTVIPVSNYTHKTAYSLPIKPSPNLPNDVSINLYPSLCFFEGTNVSVGRGTDKQFQIVGSPFFKIAQETFNFTPKPNDGAKYPKHQDKVCYGYDLSKSKSLDQINLSWLIEFYEANTKKAPNKLFFTDFFTTLAGTKTLQQQIEKGLKQKEIKAGWQEGLNNYKELRQHYLLYKD
ncbi:DUF1343 domain-containing protein [Winogradskyella sp. DF17]|uniref:DUF1343 domain-containing protein n=1 Tax=Winogradskyella pelagia TaxID=2819984 RepID=A0ABS3T4G7_9FLAO|nr:DUF1343 domain-containing protein [Winogradskyella sp. DF17]MBO3117630.1 DUF1343 domain-containing protein [Winogradskyella sp. DF17]